MYKHVMLSDYFASCWLFVHACTCLYMYMYMHVHVIRLFCFLLVVLSVVVAKHFRPGRQEDAHEFLRYFVEALQKACLHGYPTK